jgi:hypothetical protein
MAMGIAEILVKRDGLSLDEAEEMVKECKEELHERLEDGEMPMDICEEWFGLEPDYIDELIPL